MVNDLAWTGPVSFLYTDRIGTSAGTSAEQTAPIGDAVGSRMFFRFFGENGFDRRAMAHL